MDAARLSKTLCLLLIFLILTLLGGNAFADPVENKSGDISGDISGDTIVFSILPFLSPVALMKRFSPLREYLQNATGRTIALESAPNFPEYLRRTVRHHYDIVYTAPHFVPITLKDGHYQLLAASNNLAAHIIVKDSAVITRLEQLAGKRVAHGPDEAFLVVIGKHLLKEKGLQGKNAPTFVSYKSHNAALRAAAASDADAAIVGSFHLKLAAENNLRQIAATPAYPGVAILASKDLPQSFRDKLAKAFTAIKDNKEGRETLKKMRFPGFKAATASDYAPLNAIAREALDPNSFELIPH